MDKFNALLKVKQDGLGTDYEPTVFENNLMEVKNGVRNLDRAAKDIPLIFGQTLSPISESVEKDSSSWEGLRFIMIGVVVIQALLLLGLPWLSNKWPRVLYLSNFIWLSNLLQIGLLLLYLIGIVGQTQVLHDGCEIAG
jgi:hypothetical protein